jgi:predicted RNA-binding protein with PUA-like domain
MHPHHSPKFGQDNASEYYDASSSQGSPRWLMVDVQLKETLPHMVRLDGQYSIWA